MKKGWRLDMIWCLRRIEQEREELHLLVELYGFSDARVLIKSQQLDQTLNEYNRQRRSAADHERHH
ncbi:aspartyl-phosphate phosphatase Spo0E family protein [Paenibacillus campi]|uniref:aspartyl-phosphate phosphatase Spo0E family protein n=1 Tax=Paenibacillus campi TaxID=3106031 RepID=UPI002AFF8358|nr:aspartyl-phosphate phosphatase Spo0E family protein [Paenibacillus sp. SGZ-1014]